MPDILFPSRSMSVEELIASKDQAAIDAFIRDNIRRDACSTLMINSPYCLARTGPEDGAVLATLGNIPRPNRDRLMCVIDYFGETTRTLAAFYDRHLAGLELSVTVANAGTTASQLRLTPECRRRCWITRPPWTLSTVTAAWAEELVRA